MLRLLELHRQLLGQDPFVVPFALNRQVLFLLGLQHLLVAIAMSRGLDAGVRSDLALVRKHLQLSQAVQRLEFH